MPLKCTCTERVRPYVVEFYCKHCREYRCCDCVKPCKTAHPDLVLDSRVVRQLTQRFKAAVKNVS